MLVFMGILLVCYLYIWKREVGMGLESHLGDNILTTTLNTMVNWARKSSLWPMPFGLACCSYRDDGRG